MEVKDVGRAGLVGMRGRVGRRVAEEVGKRTRLDADTVAAGFGFVIVALLVHRLVQIARRLQAAR